MQVDEKLYYSDYTIKTDVSARKNSDILIVKFNNWVKGCDRPRKAILKIFNSNREVFHKEAKQLREISEFHKNIVKYYHEHIVEEITKGRKIEKFCIYMELCKHDSVAKQMQTVNWHITKRLRISCDIVDVLSVIHSHSRAHRDINPHNIFLTGKDKVRIGDFDFAKEVRLGGPHTVGGTRDYMSPFLKCLRDLKMQNDECINPYKEDVWSTGKTLYEIITYQGRESLLGEYTYSSDTALEEEKKVKAKARRNMQNCQLQDEAIEIILSMLTFDAGSRISMKKANSRFKKLPVLNEEIENQSDSNCHVEETEQRRLEAKIPILIAEKKENETQKSLNDGNFQLNSISSYVINSENSQTVQSAERHQTSENSPQTTQGSKSCQISEGCDNDYKEDKIDILKSTAPETEENKTSSQENIDEHSSNGTEENKFSSREETLESQENIENANSGLEESEILSNRELIYIEDTSNVELCKSCRNELPRLCEKCSDLDMVTWFIREKVFLGCNYSEITCIWCDNLFPKKIFQCEIMHFGKLPDFFFK